MENSRFIDIHVLVLYSSNGIRFRHLTSAELIRSWVFRSIFWERGFGSAPPMPGVVMEYQSALQGAVPLCRPVSFLGKNQMKTPVLDLLQRTGVDS